MIERACDFLCISPHSDDAEIALGGTLRLLADHGRRIWICDLTRGELASNADPATRWAEAQAAGRILGLTGRLQLSLPDGFLTETDRRHILPVVHILRLLRPSWVVTAPAAHRHPDHLVVPALARRAIFLSRLASLETSAADARWWPQEPQTGHGGPWTPEVVADTCPVDRTPDMFFDITDTWAAKSEALSCYASQFNRAEGRRAPIINDPGFLQEVEAVGRRWDRRAGVKHAEALRVDMRPVFDDLPQGRWA